MSEFDRHSYNQGGRDATPTESMDKTSSWSWKNLGRWKSIWTPKNRGGIDGASALYPGSAAAPSRWKSWPVKNWPVTVLLLLLFIPLVGVTVGYLTRLKSGTGSTAGSVVGNSIGTLSHGTTAKPAPGKPLVPEPEPPPASPPPRVLAPAAPQRPPAPASPPQSAATAPLSVPAPPAAFKSAPPPVPAVAAGTPYPQVVYPARHDKHFGESCSGKLTLNSSGLLFDCPDDPGGGVQVAINQIGSVDENGIRLTSGKKYHFSIPGMTKISEQELFADWFNRVR
jgi:hypothetical protein